MENECRKPLQPKPFVFPQIFRMSEKIKEENSLLPIAIEPKKQMMSLMDTLLTLFIVSPLIVGQWRGTWDLMDAYSSAFPAWESFLFGGALHLSFAIMRDGLQDLIKFKTETLPKTVLAYFLRRLYTYLFAAACIMNWRGGWIIFDEWLDIEVSPDGRVKAGKSLPIVIGIYVVSLVILGVLRSLRNTLAAPFVIGLDTKSTAFDFPTRYRISVSRIFIV